MAQGKCARRAWQLFVLLGLHCSCSGRAHRANALATRDQAEAETPAHSWDEKRRGGAAEARRVRSPWWWWYADVFCVVERSCKKWSCRGSVPTWEIWTSLEVITKINRECIVLQVCESIPRNINHNAQGGVGDARKLRSMTEIKAMWWFTCTFSFLYMCADFDLHMEAQRGMLYFSVLVSLSVQIQHYPGR